ncbi:glycosyltransferase family 2 protein [Desulfurobacterium thermolithotrophum]|uniref:glycosyltransferase family 2 protein n=1 Tax=Desulfurobacterium thermolithotrophum TaxID=64160 RepID=UPI0013D5BB41|nr:glycosyltransferase family 2 protein [Desulfurobacterium thermolithotrophum]
MKISACIIAKNEEENLPRLLRSIKGKFDELILVDTGSTDRTKEIAKEYGCKVIEHEWKGFADARNRAIKEATGDWIWHFDADFELEEEEYKKALLFFKYLPKEIEGISICIRNFDAVGRIKALSSNIFIHRNKKHIVWKGKVHETPVVKVAIGVPIFVNHYGYIDKNILLKKAERNLKLLEDEISTIPKQSREYALKLFFFVQTYLLLAAQDKNFLEEAEKYAKEFIEISQYDIKKYDFFLAYMLSYLANIYRMKNDKKNRKKIEDIIIKAENLQIELPDIYIIAFDYYKEIDKEKAIKYLIKAAYLLDKAEENLFQLNFGAAVEGQLSFEKALDFLKTKGIPPEQNIIDEAYKLWKREKGKNLGLLLYFLLPEKEKEKIAKKIARRYPTNSTLKVYFEELEKKEKWETILKLIEIYKNYPVVYLYKAKLKDKKGNFQSAISDYLYYLLKNPDKEVANYVIPKLAKIYPSTSDNK